MLWGKIAFWGMCTCVCAQVYVRARVAYTLHTCTSTCRCVWEIDVLYVHLKNLFMVNWPRAEVPTTDVPLRAHIACLQVQRNLSQNGSWRVALRKEECTIVPDSCLTHAEVWSSRNWILEKSSSRYLHLLNPASSLWMRLSRTYSYEDFWIFTPINL